MGAPATSFEVRGDNAGQVVAAVVRSVAAVTRPAGALVFCCGKLADRLLDVAERLRDVTDVPVVLVGGPGVLSERGELEGANAATGLVWGGNAPRIAQEDSTELTADHLSALLPGPKVGSAPTALFVRSEGFDPHELWRLRDRGEYPHVFGAGVHGDPGLVCVCERRVSTPRALSLTFVGQSPPAVLTAHSCRLLAEPMPITRAEGAMIYEIGDNAALSVLEQLGAGLRGRPLVFTVLCSTRKHEEGGSPELLVRGIQGVDPGRRGLLITHELGPDMSVTFAVRDGAAAREDIVRVCRQSSRAMAGAAPRFALYFNCSGRGRSLYNSPNVDTRVLREQFANMPIAGVQSAFEIGPFDGSPALQLYTGIFALFGSPS